MQHSSVSGARAPLRAPAQRRGLPLRHGRRRALGVVARYEALLEPALDESIRRAIAAMGGGAQGAGAGAGAAALHGGRRAALRSLQARAGRAEGAGQLRCGRLQYGRRGVASDTTPGSCAGAAVRRRLQTLPHLPTNPAARSPLHLGAHHAASHAAAAAMAGGAQGGLFLSTFCALSVALGALLYHFGGVVSELMRLQKEKAAGEQVGRARAGWRPCAPGCLWCLSRLRTAAHSAVRWGPPFRAPHRLAMIRSNTGACHPAWRGHLAQRPAA